MCLFNCFHCFGTHIGFNAHISRNAVNKVAAFGNNRMYTHYITLAESFTQCVNAHQPQHSSVKCINSLIRCICRVRRFAHILNGFTDKTIA